MAQRQLMFTCFGDAIGDITFSFCLSFFFGTRVSIDENINVVISIHMDVGMYKNLQAKERTANIVRVVFGRTV